MALTREEAIKEFRDMWNWIADETEREKRYVPKVEYFIQNYKPPVKSDCYLCEYDYQQDASDNFSYGICNSCPIDFNVNKEELEEPKFYHGCTGYLSSPYRQWMRNKKGWERDAELARMIANLPEKEVIL